MPLPHHVRPGTRALSGFENYDASHMACHLLLAAGDLAESRRYADVVAALPFFREERHIGLGRRVEVDTMAGDFDSVVACGELIEHDWARAGRPVAGNLAVGAYCVATVHGMLGDPARHRHWADITAGLLGGVMDGRGRDLGWAQTLGALAALHTGKAQAALDRLALGPDDTEAWGNPNTVLWLPWYAALWVEAAVLAGHPDAADRIAPATHAARANPIALAMVERGQAILRGERDRLPDLARRFAAAGCPYQEARTMRLAKG